MQYENVLVLKQILFLNHTYIRVSFIALDKSTSFLICSTFFQRGPQSPTRSTLKIPSGPKPQLGECVAKPNFIVITSTQQRERVPPQKNTLIIFRRFLTI